MNIDKLKNFIQPYCNKKDMMHNLCHIDRILESVGRLVKDGKYDIDMEIIIYAAYFHEFIDESKEELLNWLITQEISEDRIEKIIKLAMEMHKDEAPNSIEGKVLHDAHMIEGKKTYLVIKALIIGCSKKQTMEETINYIENSLANKKNCCLPQSEKFYFEQQEYTKEFIQTLRDKLKNK